MTGAGFVCPIPLRSLASECEFVSGVCGSHSTGVNFRIRGVVPSESVKELRRQIQSAANSGGKKGEKKGLFGRLKDAVLRPIVTVAGGSGSNYELVDCVFCKGSGFNDCDACKGSGKDSLGTCLMCGGKTYLECTVCRGVGTVDRVRRGGTDDSGQYLLKNKKKT